MPATSVHSTFLKGVLDNKSYGSLALKRAKSSLKPKM